VELVADDQAGAGIAADAADGLDDVGHVRSGGDGKAEETGELGGQHPGGRRRWDGHVEHRDSAGVVRVPLLVYDLVGLAELGDRRRFARGGCPGQDQSSAGTDRVPVEQGQPAAGVHDLLDGGGSDDAEPGVVVQPGLVIEQPVAIVESCPVWARQQRRNRGLVGAEPSPSLQGGQMTMGFAIVNGSLL
jgi:hypothetical protein